MKYPQIGRRTSAEIKEDCWLKADVGAVHISTVALPRCEQIEPYETALRLEGAYTIVDRYDTRERAYHGHVRYCAMTESELRKLCE